MDDLRVRPAMRPAFELALGEIVSPEDAATMHAALETEPDVAGIVIRDGFAFALCRQPIGELEAERISAIAVDYAIAIAVGETPTLELARTTVGDVIATKILGVKV